MIEPADFNKWGRLPAWKIWQACYLLWGLEPDADAAALFEPRGNDFDNFDNLMRGPLPGSIRQVYELVKAHAVAGDLPIIPDGAAVTAAFPDAYVRRDVLVGWARKHWDYLPHELDTASAEAEAPPERQQSSPAIRIPSATPAQLASFFRHPSEDGALQDEDGWKALAERARTNGLIAAEAEPHSGQAPRKFDVEKVAEWLISKRGQPEADTAHGVLRAIPEADEFDAMRDHWDKRTKIRRSVTR